MNINTRILKTSKMHDKIANDMKDIDNLPCMKGKGDRTLKSYQRLVINRYFQR